MSFCAELKTRFVELLKAKQAFDVAYAEDTQAVGDWQTGRWEKSLKVVKTLQSSRDELEKFRNIEIWQEIARGDFRNVEKLTLLSDAAAEHLIKYPGTLYLDGLTTLSDTAAKLLSKKEEGLGLSSLTKLSDTAAKHLSRHKGWLYLNGLTELSDTAAEHLSTFQGDLHLNGLTTISDRAAELFGFGKRQGELVLCGLTTISDRAAKHLSTYQGYLYVSDNIQAQINRFK